MPAVRVRLQWALSQLEDVAEHLEHALQNAKDCAYAPDWIATIERAIVKNQELMLHIGNIRDLITHRDEASRRALVRKES